ncbi:uncharacterized protein LOC115699938 [Cannabis sativa]|uniref:uncharacterized protein LOC115699938 n=1 Tax=Cannabis sativa TaxID=3483 RepID=UPI0029C9BB1B|nr:uncharacterized protein LOC115699938 [Cannabis sativa]
MATNLCPSQIKVNWSHEVWNRLNIPRHSFCLWITIQDRLKTRERLYKHNIIAEDYCLFCMDHPETTEHLFFSCPFSTIYLSQVKAWLGWRVETIDLSRLCRWLERAKMSKFWKAVITAAVAALVYNVWKNRNDLIWNSRRIAQDVVVRAIKEDVKNRVLCNWTKKHKPVDANWFALL